jgi:DNA-binding CsgD family transcriptional regulator
MGQRGRPRHPGLLTQREEDVLALLREGLTNEQIADRLGIGFETAKHHVSQILSKLDVTTREEAAAWQPEREPSLWTPGRIALALGGTAVFAAAVAGLALLAWGVSQAGEADSEGDHIFETQSCEEVLDRGLLGDYSLAIAWDREVCWDELEDASRYVLDLEVTFVGCDVPGEIVVSEPVSESLVLPKGTTSVNLPDPPSDEYAYPWDVSFSLVVEDSGGEELASSEFTVPGLWFAMASKDCGPLPSPYRPLFGD